MDIMEMKQNYIYEWNYPKLSDNIETFMKIKIIIIDMIYYGINDFVWMDMK